ncbi:hypothetical protein [Yunchengibacter salinarum]|uniref:hypothetical protein n=1 Tax=Yunchengibacter salinarum TaxID=3133399 RepID=UPI0035B5E7F7
MTFHARTPSGRTSSKQPRPSGGEHFGATRRGLPLGATVRLGLVSALALFLAILLTPGGVFGQSRQSDETAGGATGASGAGAQTGTRVGDLDDEDMLSTGPAATGRPVDLQSLLLGNRTARLASIEDAIKQVRASLEKADEGEDRTALKAALDALEGARETLLAERGHLLAGRSGLLTGGLGGTAGLSRIGGLVSVLQSEDRVSATARGALGDAMTQLEGVLGDFRLELDEEGAVRRFHLDSAANASRTDAAALEDRLQTRIDRLKRLQTSLKDRQRALGETENGEKGSADPDGDSDGGDASGAHGANGG